VFVLAERLPMSWTTERARVASLSRSRAPNDPDLLEAKRNLKAARLEQKIRETVDSAPRLNESQRVQLALLLNSGAA